MDAPDKSSEDLLGELVRRLGSRGTFGRYVVRGEVARGGMGAILRVRDEDLRRDLAMKVVLTPGSKKAGTTPAEDRVLGRFLEEAQVTGQLDHPGIVPVHELGLDDQGRVYFTMRLVAGRDLEKIFELVRANAEGWSQARAVGAILKVCEAVAYAHSKGVLHRDLKPANVMVGRFGEVYVMDWGLARVLGRDDRRDIRVRAPREESSTHVHSSLRDSVSAGSVSPLVTMDGDIVGTPAYMSPEQASGDLQTIGAATDVYAVGAILYHLIAGHMPYALPGSTLDAIEIWRRVRHGPPDPLKQRAPTAPPELVAICEKAMARLQSDRYPGMAELAEDLRAYLERRVVRAYERGWLAEVRKWILRNRALAGTVIGASVLILVGTTTAAIVLARKNVQISASERRARDEEARAVGSEASAKESQRIAEERAARILRLSDIKRLQELEKSAEGLWPATPATIAGYEAWLVEARELASRLGEHVQALDAIRARGTAPAKEGGDANGAGDKWTFPTTEEGWQHDNQEELVSGLRAFVDAEHGRIADVEKRLAFARSVEEETVKGARAAALWAQAIASIADVKDSPEYEGLKIAPQLGLVPLGRDPRSKLWEFGHAQTGAPATRDPATGEIQLTEETGLVFVLVPGGTFEMGSQKEDPSGTNYDPQSGLLGAESPVEEVKLAPFFISKYEMTQGQWLRFVGKNPSQYGPGSSFNDRSTDLTHPVEQVTWYDCDEVMTRLGLALPTEAQWEYAARAGTSTPWSTGADKRSLEGFANLADKAATRAGAAWTGIADWPELDDGWAVHAPVNAFQPNAFGLHNVHGNVWEWCRDWFGIHGDPVREGDGLREDAPHRFKVGRGGGFKQEAAFARSTCRSNTAPELRIDHLGLRPARKLDP